MEGREGLSTGQSHGCNGPAGPSALCAARGRLAMVLRPGPAPVGVGPGLCQCGAVPGATWPSVAGTHSWALQEGEREGQEQQALPVPRWPGPKLGEALTLHEENLSPGESPGRGSRQPERAGRELCWPSPASPLHTCCSQGWAGSAARLLWAERPAASCQPYPQPVRCSAALSRRGRHQAQVWGWGGAALVEDVGCGAEPRITRLRAPQASAMPASPWRPLGCGAGWLLCQLLWEHTHVCTCTSITHAGSMAPGCDQEQWPQWA